MLRNRNDVHNLCTVKPLPCAVRWTDFWISYIDVITLKGLFQHIYYEQAYLPALCFLAKLNIAVSTCLIFMIQYTMLSLQYIIMYTRVTLTCYCECLCICNPLRITISCQRPESSHKCRLSAMTIQCYIISPNSLSLSVFCRSSSILSGNEIESLWRPLFDYKRQMEGYTQFEWISFGTGSIYNKFRDRLSPKMSRDYWKYVTCASMQADFGNNVEAKGIQRTSLHYAFMNLLSK